MRILAVALGIFTLAVNCSPSAIAVDDPAEKITTGVQGICLLQFVPGVKDAQLPPPTPYEGAIVRILPLNGDKVIAEGKSNRDGRFKIAVKQGKYRIEALPKSKGLELPSRMEVKVEEGKLSEVTLTLRLLGV